MCIINVVWTRLFYINTIPSSVSFTNKFLCRQYMLCFIFYARNSLGSSIFIILICLTLDDLTRQAE